MNQHDCLLTLALPAALQEEVLDFLQAHPEWVSGFSVVHAEGFGAGSHLRSTIEQVRGRAQRVLVQMSMQVIHHPVLIETLGKEFPSKEIAWWLTPIMAFGRLS